MVAPASNNKGLPCEARVGSTSIQIMLGVLSFLPDLERYYKSSIPYSIAVTIWFTGTTKKSHAYLTLTDGLIILDHEDPSCAFGFHSHHHINDKSPHALLGVHIIAKIRTARGVPRGVDRVKPAEVKQINRPLPFPSLLDEWGTLEGTF
ncbi:Hypothetical predicted protein [Olea europaea subsp. europaea]|uniref:Uncharacterized protein n=1 Tax=Olea europaea subsp. europaea TaxID=158383 RepID=A0A8S0VPE3_OLEEU|nr:Hypothetical predicted protein [Olea europaea subsp. europaea]